jgi:hypothetical protein
MCLVSYKLLFVAIYQCLREIKSSNNKDCYSFCYTMISLAIAILNTARCQRSFIIRNPFAATSLKVSPWRRIIRHFSYNELKGYIKYQRAIVTRFNMKQSSGVHEWLLNTVILTRDETACWIIGTEERIDNFINTQLPAIITNARGLCI